MHIVVTVNAAWNIWNFRRSLVEALIADGHRVTILAPSDETVGDLQSIGCEFVALDMNRKGLNPIEDAALFVRFFRLFRRLKPDLVLSYTIKNNLFGGLASRMMNIAFIPNVTGLGTAFLSGTVMRKLVEGLYRAAFAKPSVVYFQNDDDQKLFIERGLVRANQAHQLPGSGIDLQHFEPSPLPEGLGELRFLMIARLLKDKGVMEFAEAASSLKDAFPSARFQLAGAIDANNRSSIDQATLDGWVAAGNIDYLGNLPDVRPTIAQSHCVVLPSYREGAPRTLIEAAAMGRPAITTNVPGCRSVVDNGVTGLLCEARSAQSLSQAMAAFMVLNRSDQQTMGEAAREKMVREYSDHIIIARYRHAIASLEC